MPEFARQIALLEGSEVNRSDIRLSNAPENEIRDLPKYGLAEYIFRIRANLFKTKGKEYIFKVLMHPKNCQLYTGKDVGECDIE